MLKLNVGSMLKTSMIAMPDLRIRSSKAVEGSDCTPAYRDLDFAVAIENLRREVPNVAWISLVYACHEVADRRLGR